MKRVKLILSGSGLKYPKFVGAIKRLKQEGYTFSEVLGTSGGAIIAAAEASGMSIEELEELCKRINPRDLMDPNWLPFGATQGLIGGNKILRTLHTELPEDFDDYKIPLNIVTFNLSRGCHQVWSTKTTPKANAPLIIRASLSLPWLMDGVWIPYGEGMVTHNGERPKKGPDELHIDGGVGANFPLDHFGTGQDVIGLRFRPITGRRTFKDKIDFTAAVIDGFIESTTREHTEDAVHARQIYLESTGGAFDLDMNPAKIQALIDEGWKSTDKALKEKPFMEAK